MPVTINVPGLGPVSIPDNIPSEQADQYVRQLAQKRGVKLDLPSPPPPPAPDRSYGVMPALRDIGVSAAGVIPGLIETAAEFTPADRALAAIGAQKGIAGLMPETEVGKDIGKYGVLRGAAKSLRDLQQEMYSEQAKSAQKEYQRKLAEQEGFFGQAGTAFKETLTTPELMASQLPESLLSMVGGRGVAKVGEKIIKAATPQVAKEAGEKALGKAAEALGEERVAKLAKLSGGPETMRTVAGAAAMQGASVANQNFIATMDMPQDKLAATTEYQDAIKSGLSPEEARLSVARGAANGALLPATALSIVAQYAVPGGTSFERLFAGATQRTLGAEGALQIAKQVSKATLGEAGSEALEEGGGQFIGNVFTPGQEDLMEGVGAAAGAAGAMGALMGGGAGGIQAVQARRAQQVIEERQQQEEQARQELDARMPPVQQIESEPTQLPFEQIRSESQGFVNAIQPGATFTLDDIVSNTGDVVSAPQDAAAVANDLLNRGEIVREPGDTLSFRRVNEDERIIPLGNPDESYVYTVPTTREGSEVNDGYTVESSALGVTRQVANQEEADKLKQAMLQRAGERAAVVDEQLNNLRAQAEQVNRTVQEASLRSDITDDQLKGLAESGQQTTQRLNDEIAKLEEQKATILAEPVVTPINPRAETGHEVRLHTPGQPARTLSRFATEQEAYDAIIDNASPEQDRLIAEDPAYEAVRNRLEERAAEVDIEEAAPEPVEMTPEMQERVTQTANRMRSVLDQMGLNNIGLNVQQRLQEVVNGKLRNVDGYYLNRVISASLGGSRDVTATIGHETIHALRELGMFSDKEWQTLTNRAKSEWVKKYQIRERYQGMLTEEKVIEEAIADAFGDWLQGDLKERGAIAGLFNRIKMFLEKFGSVLRGQGFTTSNDIFKRAREGRLEGDRVERAPEGQQFALPKTINVDGKERPTTNNEGRPIHPTEEGVQNFWRWFGNSKAVNADGTPQIWYHGTARDISEFRPKQANAIFITQSPDFAESFADSSLDWMITNANKILPKDVLRQAVINGLKEARVGEKNFDFYMKKFEQQPLKELVKYSAVSDEIYGAIKNAMPTGENIVPLFIRAEKPFDYDSKEDRDALMAWAKSLDKNNPARQFIEDKKNEVELGEWDVIESPAVQSFLKENGYDGFYVSEGGNKNLAVYDPNQLKSATGNTGAFSRDSGEIQYALPLTPEETQDIVKRARGDAELGRQMLGVAANMTPEERQKLSRANAVKMIDLLGTFPTAEEYAAVAFAGRVKRGWYENSAKALITVFGGEAPRFAALLAALSPQCSVQTNLKNTLNVWKNWTAAGRPKDRAGIMRIMAVSVEGTGTEKSVLGAWKNNAVRALTAQNYIDFKLSGPKVNSFYLNLIGVTEEVTNDTWMANFAFVDQKLFNGSLNKKGTDPGKGPGYLATNVVVRQAADRLTELTGQKWTPAEVQETVWSWAKALYEGAESNGISPVQFLTDGKLTDELINSVPDFKSLFFDETYESILRSAGYGQQLDELIQQRNANRAELSEQEQGIADEAAPFTPTSQKEFEVAAAERLERLKQKREKEKAAKAKKPAVVFEVAPDPKDEALANAWKSMSQEERLKSSERILNKILPRVMEMLGAKGFAFNQVGSYGPDTNPSFSVKVTKGDAPKLANYLGFILSQESMMVISPNKFKGSDTVGAIAVEIADDSPANVEAIYNSLREIEVNGEKPIGGQSTINGKMLILNYSELSTEELAKLVNEKLGDKYKVKTHNVYSSFPEQKDYDYASREGDPRGNEGVIRERSRTIRNEAAQEIRRELAQAGIKVSDTPGGKPEVSKDAGQYALPQNVLGQPAPLANWTNPTDSKLANFIYSVQDKMIDLKRVIQEITRAGVNIADRWNPYLQEELYHGRTAQQTEKFLRTEVRPLLQDMERSNISIAELEEYAHNRHAEERNIQIATVNPNLPDAGSGISTQAARNYLNALPQQRRMVLERLARRLDDINKGTRQTLVRAGLETPQAIAAWEQTYPNYMPLFREDADYVTSSGYGVGQGFSVRGEFSKRATGSTRNVVDIFANIMMQRERAIVRAEKNRVAQALYGLAVQNPNKQFWMVVDPEAVQNPAQLQADIISMGINPTDIQNIFQQPTKPNIDPQTGLVTNKLDPFVLKSDHVMAVRINGRNQYIMFNNNDPTAKRMVEAIKNLDADQLGRTLNIMGKISRWVSLVNTQYNPIFGVVNLFRDVQGATLNLSTTPIADKVKDVMSPTNLAGAMKGIWSTSRAERTSGALPASQWAKLWQELQEEGGQTGYRTHFSTSQERAEALQKELNAITAGKAKKAGMAVIDVLSDYNTSMENAVRVSAYKAALDKGLSKQQAASIAKNITVNFNRKGQIGTQAGAMYAFFNASVQGTARLVETMKGPLGKKILYGGLLVGVMQAMMLAAAGFDEDEPPDFVKERNLVIPLEPVSGKKNYLTVPLPLGFNVLPNVSRNLTEWWMSGFKDPAKRIAQITGSVVEAFNPIGGSGLSLQTLSPTPIDPFIALAENKDSFGRPIYRPDMSGLDPTPGYTRAKDSAGYLTTGIAEFLNAASGGTKYKPGFISPTPDQLDYLAGQVGGGVYREISKTEQSIKSAITKEELPSYKMPLVGRFYGNADDNAVQMQRFYTNITRLNEHENEIKGRIKNREPVYDYFKENPEARLIKMGNSVEYNIRKLKQQRDLMKERGADQRVIQNINDRIIRLMKQLNERVEKAEG